MRWENEQGVVNKECSLLIVMLCNDSQLHSMYGIKRDGNLIMTGEQVRMCKEVVVIIFEDSLDICLGRRVNNDAPKSG